MPDVKRPHFILASASPRRAQLLKQAGLTPDEVIAADIDETPLKHELPTAYAARIAAQKAHAIATRYPHAVVLAADTVVACGRRILPKAEDEKTAKKCLTMLSGRRHRVYTAVTLSKGNESVHRLAVTQVRFNRMTDAEIAEYIRSGQWHGKAGGYAIQGLAEAFISWINGSYSNVVGLPLSETCQMLKVMGVVPVGEA